MANSVYDLQSTVWLQAYFTIAQALLQGVPEPLPRVKRTRRGVDRIPQSGSEVKDSV